MKTKVFCCFMAVLMAMLTLPAVSAASSARDPFSAVPTVSYSAAHHLTMPVVTGEVLELDTRDLERRLGITEGGLEGITIIGLPDGAHGLLVLDEVEVDAYDYLTRSEIDRLCFIPRAGVTSASFSLLPHVPGEHQDATAASLNIKVLAQKNNAPTLDGLQLQTVKNIRVSGYFNAYDADGDELTFRTLTSPGKGKLTLSGAGFSYEPFYNLTGSDSFTVCAMDSVGNFSEPALVQIEIENNKQSFQYADMLTHPSHYAAIKLREAGVLTGWQVGDDHFLFPDRALARGDFLLLLLEASNVTITPSAHSGLPNDSDLPQWIKPYVKAAVEYGILPKNKAFAYYEIPTRAEAVVMTNIASKIGDVKRFDLWMPDASDIPDWAESSYMNLAAYRMLDLHDGRAWPTKALTNSYGADLIWQLYKHIHR